MSTEVVDVFTIDYVREFAHVFQRKGCSLGETVMRKDGVTGASTSFPRIGTLTTTGKGRDGKVPSQNPEQRRIPCVLEDRYARTQIDQLDEAKTSADVFQAHVQAAAMAMGRRCDETILAAVNGTSQTGLAFTLTTYGTVRNSLLQIPRAFNTANAYEPGSVYCVLTPVMWQCAQGVDSFANAELAGRPLFTSEPSIAGVTPWKYWAGVWWTTLNANEMAIGTSSAKGFAWHKNAVGFATGAHPMNMAQAGMITGPVGARIEWSNEYAAHDALHVMSLGACLIDDAGAYEITLNESSVTFPST